MKKETLVLAYSGGLDTSYSLKKLSLDNYEVHAVSVNTGGFSEKEIDTIEAKAYQMGAFTYQKINAIKPSLIKNKYENHSIWSIIFKRFNKQEMGSICCFPDIKRVI